MTRPASKRSRRRSSRRPCRAGAVGGEDELRAGAVERVERVEELLLGAGLALQELDVVDEQHVGVPIRRLEGVHVVAVERAEEVVGEVLDGRVTDRGAVAVRLDVVRDRVEEVGLAETGRPADEQRVVGQPGHLGDRERRGVREAVRVADDELVEREAGVDHRRAGAWRCGGGSRGLRRRGRGGVRCREAFGVAARDEPDGRSATELARRARVQEPAEASLDADADVIGRG